LVWLLEHLLFIQRKSGLYESTCNGRAGFIGSHLSERLLNDGLTVIGVDNFDDFYDPHIKRRNIEGCLKNKNLQLVEADIRDSTAMDKTIVTALT